MSKDIDGDGDDGDGDGDDDKHRNNSPQICLIPATASFILVALTLMCSSNGNGDDGSGDDGSGDDGSGDDGSGNDGSGDDGSGDDGSGNDEVGSSVSFFAIAAAFCPLSLAKSASLLLCIDRV